MQKIPLLIATILVSSCCGIPQKAEIPLPPETICPDLSDKELEGVSRETYLKLIDLDIACKITIPSYRDIIKATH